MGICARCGMAGGPFPWRHPALFSSGYFDFAAPYRDSYRLVFLRPEMLGIKKVS